MERASEMNCNIYIYIKYNVGIHKLDGMQDFLSLSTYIF